MWVSFVGLFCRYVGLFCSSQTSTIQVCIVDVCAPVYMWLMCCSVLQCVAVCCSVLQCVAPCVLQRHEYMCVHVVDVCAQIISTSFELPNTTM